MSEKEVNTISHLLEVEQRATELTSQAQLDADKKIAAAKAQADSAFKAEYDKIISDCENNYAEKTSALKAQKEENISSYKNKISSAPLDKSAFNSFLDSIFFK
ncbi:MAG: hypothetical protein K5873_02825 [Treponema sp.]|nr:hypothetical protein [Treponema sp.]